MVFYFENGSHSFSQEDMIEIKDIINFVFLSKHRNKETETSLQNSKYYQFIKSNQEKILKNMEYLKSHKSIMCYELI